MHVIIIGAGIGGATAAIALRCIGAEVSVYERAPEPREVGAGIALGANAMMALGAVGAAEVVAGGADPITGTDLLTRRGKLILHTPVASIEREYPNRSVLIHRADLLDALLSLLPAGAVHFGRVCARVEPKADRARVHFADGSSYEADAIVGADGIRSAVRESLLGREEARYSGYTGWRGIAPGASALVEPGRTCEYWGRGARFGYGRCGKDRVYWYATLNTPAGGVDEPDPIPALLSAFGAWASPVPELIKGTPPGAVLRNDIIDRPPVKQWGRGNVTLLGDAAHPTTPNLGQGACMAIEDAVVLAHHLKDARSVDEALRAYEQARMPRTAMITKLSWQLGRIGQWESWLACAIRDAAFARTPRSLMNRKVRAIVGHRVSL